MPPPHRNVPTFYDAHNHFQDDWLRPHRDGIDANLRAAGLRAAVVNGTSESDWAEVAALAAEHDWVIPSCGLHPWDVGNRSEKWQANLAAALAAADRALSATASTARQTAMDLRKVGLPTEALAKVGEIGLDRWILERARADDPRLAGLRRAPLDEQAEVFAWQLELAAAQGRAASVHCLDAFGALLDLLRRCRRPAQGFLLHAYSGPEEMVAPFADLGAYFSFNGSFLAARHAARREVFRRMPANRLLVETDAPAMRLPPELERFPALAVPDGSLANHPANIAATYAALADLRGEPLPQLAAQVESNFLRLFGPLRA